MASADGLRRLDERAFNRLQEIVERFEKDCATEFPRPLHAYLPAVGDSIRVPVLFELVRTDLELRWRHGRPVKIEHYIKRYPELKESGSLPTLLHDEYTIRNQRGENPELDEYKQRFPGLYPSFARLAEGEKSTDVGGGKPEARSMPTAEHGEVSAEATAASKSQANPNARRSMSPRAGHYTLMRKIGSGGFGEVWEAVGRGGVRVAVKRTLCSISQEAIDREKASLELICSGSLRHPFLLQVFEWWIDEEGQLNIAMELADESLDQQLKSARKAGKKGLPFEQLKQVFLDAADALDYLNFNDAPGKRRIQHRDIKPANMLLMGGRLKICDFGLSRISEQAALISGRTKGAGTPVFIAPEVVEGAQSDYSDQYSLAATYYMLRTGLTIFKGSAREIRNQHAKAAPQLIDNILSPAEKAALLRGLAKVPSERYPNSRSMVTALIQAYESNGKGSDPPDRKGVFAGDANGKTFADPLNFAGPNSDEDSDQASRVQPVDERFFSSDFDSGELELLDDTPKEPAKPVRDSRPREMPVAADRKEAIPQAPAPQLGETPPPPVEPPRPPAEKPLPIPAVQNAPPPPKPGERADTAATFMDLPAPPPSLLAGLKGLAAGNDNAGTFMDLPPPPEEDIPGLGAAARQQGRAEIPPTPQQNEKARSEKRPPVEKRPMEEAKPPPLRPPHSEKPASEKRPAVEKRPAGEKKPPAEKRPVEPKPAPQIEPVYVPPTIVSKRPATAAPPPPLPQSGPRTMATDQSLGELPWQRKSDSSSEDFGSPVLLPPPPIPNTTPPGVRRRRLRELIKQFAIFLIFGSIAAAAMWALNKYLGETGVSSPPTQNSQ